MNEVTVLQSIRSKLEQIAAESGYPYDHLLQAIKGDNNHQYSYHWGVGRTAQMLALIDSVYEMLFNNAKYQDIHNAIGIEPFTFSEYRAIRSSKAYQSAYKELELAIFKSCEYRFKRSLEWLNANRPQQNNYALPEIYKKIKEACIENDVDFAYIYAAKVSKILSRVPKKMEVQHYNRGVLYALLRAYSNHFFPFGWESLCTKLGFSKDWNRSNNNFAKGNAEYYGTFYQYFERRLKNNEVYDI